MLRFLILIGIVFAFGAHAQTPDINLLAFSNGALIERTTSDYGSGWEALWLLDDDPATGWATEKDAKLPVEIVISLPERSEFYRFEFDTSQTETAERAAKDVDIFVSDISATAGFTKVASIQLRPQEDGQTVAATASGRWVKLVVKTTNGSTEYAEIMDVRGIGVPLTTTNLPDLSGTYESPSYGLFHLRQDGADLTGCYETKSGLVHGGMEGHLMRLRWTEEGGGTGPALMVLFRDGKGFRGMWHTENETRWNANWDLRKISNDVGGCPHWNPKGPNANPVTAGLAAEGRVRLYGINFDTGSDKIRPDAKPALDQILAALKTNPGWSITVEGHTDAMGTADSNRDLSNRRAASVKAALIAGGIAENRVATAGYGQDQPIAPNTTSFGRSQNRRVELVKQ